MVVGPDNVVLRDPKKEQIMLPSGKPMVSSLLLLFRKSIIHPIVKVIYIYISLSLIHVPFFVTCLFSLLFEKVLLTLEFDLLPRLIPM